MPDQRNGHATTRNGPTSSVEDTLAVDGRKLRELRKRKGLSQEGVAKKVGIAVRQLQNLESEKTETRLATASYLAMFYEVGIEEIIKGGSEGEERQNLPRYFRDPGVRSRVFAAFEEEVRVSLFHLPVSSVSQFNLFVGGLRKNLSFRKLLGQHWSAIEQLKPPILASDRCGVNSDALVQLRKHLLDHGGITVSVPVTMLSALVVLRYMADVQDLAISVDCNSGLGSELLARLGNSDSSACILPTGSTAALLSQSQNSFVPIMPWPGGTQEILCSPKSLGRVRTIGVLNNRPSSSVMFLEDQDSSGRIMLSCVKLIHMEPEEIVATIALNREAEGAAFCQWFPQSLFSRLFGRYAPAYETAISSAGNGSLLFLHRKLAEDDTLRFWFDVCARDAFFSLMEDRELRSSIVRRVADSNYLKMLGRITGLQNFSATGGA